MLIGVDDKNTITDVTIDNSKRSSLQNILGEISPKLHYEFYTVDVDGKTVAVIDVPSGPNKPDRLSGSVYVRQGPNLQKLTSAKEIRSFYQQSDKIYFDETPCAEANIQKISLLPILMILKGVPILILPYPNHKYCRT